MPYNDDIQNEINLLVRFSQSSDHQGIKVHQDASPDMVTAVQSLFNKGLTTQMDGGYLTPLGHEAADQAHALLNILSAKS
ncbi:TIGR02647 family protein [Amphritea sp. HPY]|uniref:TIGR02647 family protein n=1 Tax=Amphritea sp. HPY TaxID=3421652 RepID=UPI003D7EFFE5